MVQAIYVILVAENSSVDGHREAGDLGVGRLVPRVRREDVRPRESLRPRPRLAAKDQFVSGRSSSGFSLLHGGIYCIAEHESVYYKPEGNRPA